MELLQIEYFRKIAQLQHMTNAARELHISQPALSKTIRALETELGVQLFDRVGKAIRLNEAGHIFLNYTETALLALSEAKARVQDYIANNAVTISISLRIAPAGIPDVLAQFRRLHPNVKFELEQHQFLLNNFGVKSDLILYSGVAPADTPCEKTLLYDRVLLCVPQSHPFAAHESIPMRWLEKENLIGSSQQGNSIDSLVNMCCRQAGFAPNIVTVCDDYITNANFARSGLGLGFLPETTVLGIRRFYPDLRFLTLRDPDCIRYITLRWDEHRYMPHAAAQFREFLLEYYRELQRLLDTDPERAVAMLSDFPPAAIDLAGRES